MEYGQKSWATVYASRTSGRVTARGDGIIRCPAINLVGLKAWYQPAQALSTPVLPLFFLTIRQPLFRLYLEVCISKKNSEKQLVNTGILFVNIVVSLTDT